MSKNPVINGLSATAYIVVLVLVMNTVMKLAPHPNAFIAPLAVISLFTLSAAVMGYLFCFQPAQLYFEGKKKQAVSLFLQTVAAFAVCTAVIFIIMVSGIFR